jgi:hypothetical protein
VPELNDFIVDLTGKTVSHKPTGLIWQIIVKKRYTDLICTNIAEVKCPPMNEFRVINMAASEAYQAAIKKK